MFHRIKLTTSTGPIGLFLTVKFINSWSYFCQASQSLKLYFIFIFTI